MERGWAHRRQELISQLLPTHLVDNLCADASSLYLKYAKVIVSK